MRPNGASVRTDLTEAGSWITNEAAPEGAASMLSR
jgi:hypothetical protein